MKTLFAAFFLLALALETSGQSQKAIYIDLDHGQRFWNDPDVRVEGIGWDDQERVRYINNELSKTLAPLNVEVHFIKQTLSYNDIQTAEALVLHAPSSDYTQKEIRAIQKYLGKGGSLLLVMEADYWTDLTKTNVNEIIEPYGMHYGKQSTDTLAGGYTLAGPIFSKRLKITYQHGRSLEGGKAFAFNVQDGKPFGVYRRLDSGGKIVLLGDAMSTMYMTEWKGVKDYQCQEFMTAIYGWLLADES